MNTIQPGGETLKLLVELTGTAVFALSGAGFMSACGRRALALQRNWQLPSWRV